MASISLHQVQALLERGFSNAAKDAGMFNKMGASLLYSVRQNFRAQQAPDGTSWTPLKAATVRRRGSAEPILRRTNRLYQTLTYTHDSEHAQVGANTTYARIHQLGGRIKRKAGSHPMNFSRNNETGAMRLVKGKRANFIMDVDHKAYDIPIPARPYLYNTDGTVPTGWKVPLVRIFVRHLRSALKASAGASGTGGAS